MHRTLVCIAHFPCNIGKKEKQKYTSIRQHRIHVRLFLQACLRRVDLSHEVFI